MVYIVLMLQKQFKLQFFHVNADDPEMFENSILITEKNLKNQFLLI